MNPYQNEELGHEQMVGVVMSDITPALPLP